MKEDKELIAWLAFNRFSLENLKASVTLYRTFKDPLKIWNLNQDELKSVEGIHLQTVFKIIHNAQKYLGEGERDLEKVRRLGGEILILDDLRYPEELKSIYDPPPVLFTLGDIDGLLQQRKISIVGSRFASTTGCKNAKKMARDLADAGFMIVSGLARGLDTNAHEGALETGTTAAILGSGLDIVYPPENKVLFERIIKKGCVVTEFPPGTPPDRFNFPRRNRVISGISEAVVVVEAAKKSGSLITASFALEQGREVFAVPGEISAHFSEGSNNLIKQGAQIVTESSDILEALDWHGTVYHKEISEKKEDKDYAGLSSLEKKVLECIGDEPIHVDEIISNSGLKVSEAQSALLMLELNGFIKQEIGKRYKRI